MPSSVLTYAQSVDNDPVSCQTCVLSPDQLITYRKFVRSALDILQSTSRIDFDKLYTGTKQAQVNILTDYKKQESDSYLGVVKQQGRIVETELQSAWRAVQTEWLRDFAGDFWRQFVGGAKSSVYTRDEKKLEEVDERIDTDATTHINNFVFGDAIPNTQVVKLKELFVAYNSMFQPIWAWWLEANITYKTFIGRLNNLNRKVKNHIIIRPKRDFKRATEKWVNYTLNPTWTQWLADSYACVGNTVIGNCNPTWGKTRALAKEFGNSVWNDFDHIGNKFKSSINKLKGVFSWSTYKGYFDGFGSEWGVGIDINGQRLGSNNKNPVQPKTPPAQKAKEEKQAIKELLDECRKDDNTQYKVKERRVILGPIGYNKTIWCKDRVAFEYQGVALDGMTENEAAKWQRMITSMNDWVDSVASSTSELDDLSKLLSPMDVTPLFQDLSKSVYAAKGTLSALIKSSIKGCLAYCSNLNDRIKCWAN